MTSSNVELERILSFENFIGSDCRGVEDLLLMDAETLAFKSGQYLYFFKINTKILTSMKCTDGLIGAITMNINNSHLAIAENGRQSKISIRSYPSMETVNTCTANTTEWTHLSYSRTGELLASQCEVGVTIWNWMQATILLKFENSEIRNNFDLKFSMGNDRFLYTGGAKYVHFWDIVQTFTGLKLLHKIGHFRKLKSCDILTVCPSDNHLLTNCEWGNILVWEDGKIKFEICRKNRQPLHNSPITQIILCKGYLYTIGFDNYVRIWFWDTVAIEDMREYDKIIEFEAIYEYEIKSQSNNDLLSFTIYSGNKQFNNYIHDGNGVIWKSVIDLDFTSHNLEVIFRASSKDVVCVQMSPVSTQLITLDIRGVLCLYNYKSGRMVFHHRFFPITASTLAWCSKKIDDSGKTILFGFEDGSIRVTCSDINENNWEGSSIRAFQHIKPHTNEVKQIVMSNNIVASVSDDKTIFIYTILQNVNEILLNPIGFIPMNSTVQQISFQKQFLIVANDNNELLKIFISSDMRHDQNSYLLKEYTNSVNKMDFTTDSKLHQVILITTISDKVVWILLSNGNIYDDSFTIIKESGSICYYVTFENKYVIICYANANISVERILSHQPTQFEQIYMLSIPQDFQIQSSRMNFSFDYSNLIIHNSSGSVLCYKWKLAIESSENIYSYQRCMIEHQIVDEDSVINCLSLEEQKRVELENQRKTQYQERKTEILEIIAKLKNDFAIIKYRNNELSDTFQMSPSAFEIDKRITEDLKWRTQLKFKVIQKELQMKIDKIREHAERMEHIYLDNLEHWPIKISGFRSRKMLETFLIYEINDEFQALKIQFDDRGSLTTDSSESNENRVVMNRPEGSNDSVRLDRSRSSLHQANEYICSIAEQIDNNQVDIQTKRLYKRYMARKQQDIEHRKQRKQIEVLEPRISCSKSSDDNLECVNIEATADFEAQANQTIVNKYRLLKSLKQQMTQNKQDFNGIVLNLQEEKLKKCDILSEKIENLRQIYKKLYCNMIDVNESSEIIVQFDGKSFKDKYMNIKYLKTKQKPFDESNEKHRMDIWTIDLHKTMNSLFFQIENIYQDFDVKIKNIVEQSIEISLKVQFKELYYFVIYQELLVLNKFEKPNKALLKSIELTIDKLQTNEEELTTAKSKFKKLMKDDALIDTNGKIIEMEVLFKENIINDSAIADQQLEILKKITALPMSSTQSQIIKPLVGTIECLLKDSISFNKDLKG
ncbi:uncharacterized protein LOC116336928 isoform X2 [Contarinia nasturtii]|nr:uncharacterized protein LOC116336928 isoform X2 [Contarinia nasturtii]